MMITFFCGTIFSPKIGVAISKTFRGYQYSKIFLAFMHLRLCYFAYLFTLTHLCLASPDCVYPQENTNRREFSPSMSSKPAFWGTAFALFGTVDFFFNLTKDIFFPVCVNCFLGEEGGL